MIDMPIQKSSRLRWSIIATLAISSGIGPAAAGESRVTAHRLNADHAMVVELPEGWSTTHIGIREHRGEGGMIYANADGASFSVSFEDMNHRLGILLEALEVYMKRGSVERRDAGELGHDEVVELAAKGSMSHELETSKAIVFEEGRKTLNGVVYSFWEWGPRKLWTGTATVDNSLGPTTLTMIGLADTRYQLRVVMDGAANSSDSISIERYRAAGEDFEKILDSLRLVPLDEIAGAARRTFEGAVTRISARRDYWVDMGLSITLPASWHASEEQVEAGANREMGRYLARFVEPVKGDIPGVSFLAVLVGLEPVPHTKADFIATGDSLVASILGDDRKLVSREEIDLAPLFHLARLAPPRGESTGRTVISTWEGTGAESGRPFRVAVYTAGGLTVAANFLYAAEVQRFEAVRPTIDEMLTSMSVGVYSPSIRF